MILTLVSVLIGVFVLLVLLELVSDRLMKPVITGANPTHLIVLQHGWFSLHLRSYPLLNGIGKFVKRLSFENSNQHYVVHANQSNSDLLLGLFRTNDGIDKGGIRLSQTIEGLLREHPSITKLSMIGSSLGGLYHRYAIAHLYSDDSSLFRQRKIQCVNYVSLVTPHLGVSDSILKEGLCLDRSRSSDICDHSANSKPDKLGFKANLKSMIQRCSRRLIKDVLHKRLGVIPATLTQLMRLDNDQLIHQMANDRCFIESMGQFENVICYATASHDTHVSFCSAAVLRSLTEDGSYQSFVSKYNNHSVCDVKDAIDPDVFAEMNGQMKITKSPLSTNSEIHNNTDDVWFHRLQSEINWQRYVCFLSGSRCTKLLTHQIVSGPIPGYKHSKPIFEHLVNHFKF